MRAQAAALTLFLALVACSAAVIAVDHGCAAYGRLRAEMPPLGGDPVSVWAAKLDTVMTGVCRGR